MQGYDFLQYLLLAVFIVGYLAIILEFHIKVNKTAVALVLSVICWLIYFGKFSGDGQASVGVLTSKLGNVSQILFFLLGAMTLVELIDSHKGFNTVIYRLNIHSKKKMLWIVSFVTFLLSAVLDNLTTTLLMISLLRKLVPKRKERFVLLCMVIVAANSGGAWTPIGDVTTTMLWINGQLSTLKVVKEIFLPSLVSMLVPLLWFTCFTSGSHSLTKRDFQEEALEPGAKLVFFLGIICFLLVPVFKWWAGLPPFMGMLLSLAILWLVTDLMHHKHEHRSHLRVPFILTKIDVASILFFLGIILSVDAIEAMGLLKRASQFLNVHVHSPAILATMIGVLSAIVDNVPLVAAAMGMYKIETFPMDSPLWLMIAYAAGTGGSILLIGSAAGVAMMGLEKIDFLGYFRKMTLPVFIGYLLGLGVYLSMSN